MTLTVKPVFTDHFHQTWPLVEDFFKTVLKVDAEEYTIDQIKGLLSQGVWLLLVAVDEQNEIHGAGTIEFINKFNDRVAFITAIGGKLINGAENYVQFKELLRTFGATYIEGAVRGSVARLWSRYGFEEKYRIVGVKL